jgi:hypothetical protein
MHTLKLTLDRNGNTREVKIELDEKKLPTRKDLLELLEQARWFLFHDERKKKNAHRK